MPESRGSGGWVRSRAASFAAVSLLAAVLPNWDVVAGGKTFLPVGTVQGVYQDRPYAAGYRGSAPAHSGGVDGGAIAWALMPWAYHEHRALASGTLPFWNPHQALGEPLLSNGQTATLNPLHWMVLFDPGSPALWDA